MDDMNCTPENEDDLEAAEMRFLQKQLELDTKNKESQEEKDYKAEFFELLDEVQLIYSEKFNKFKNMRFKDGLISEGIFYCPILKICAKLLSLNFLTFHLRFKR